MTGKPIRMQNVPTPKKRKRRQDKRPKGNHPGSCLDTTASVQCHKRVAAYGKWATGIPAQKLMLTSPGKSHRQTAIAHTWVRMDPSLRSIDNVGPRRGRACRLLLNMQRQKASPSPSPSLLLSCSGLGAPGSVACYTCHTMP